MILTGKNLKEQREVLGLSKVEMAKRAGVSRPTIIKYENDELPGNIAGILEAYCLEVYPRIGIMPADLKEITSIIQKNIANNFGMKCKVKIDIELCGEEEE